MHFCTRDELLKLLGSARNHPENGERNWLMILVAYWHGFRATELVTLRGRDVDGDYVTKQRLKESLKTTHLLIEHDNPLLNEREAVKALAKKVGPDGLLFPMTRFGFYKMIRKAGREAGLPKHKCHPHAMKHSIAKHKIKDAGLHVVKQWLGHKSIKSTAEYLVVDDEEASAAISSTEHTAKAGAA